MDKDTLLKESDFLSLHCPLSDLSRNFIDKEALRKMKKTAILINVARGPVVNNADLYEALVAGEIQAAGLDVLEKEPLEAFLDLKPALDAEQLDARILREFDANHNKQFKNVIGVLFPSSLTPIMIEIGGIPGEKPVHEISREERQAFGRLIKAFPFTITGMGEFKEAIITRGGVSVKEIQPSTMESKKIKNLYFTGEVLDLDAVTGGYNLQIAWSTAYAAAQAIE